MNKKILWGGVAGIFLVVVLSMFYVQQKTSQVSVTKKVSLNTTNSTASTSEVKNETVVAPQKLAQDYYANDNFGFKIKLPEGWIVSPGKTENAIVDFVSPVADQKVGNLPLSGVIISVSDYGNQFGNDTEAARNYAVAWLSRNYQNFKVLKEERMTLNDSDSYLFSGSYISDGIPFIAQYLVVCSNSLKDFFITAPVNGSAWNQYQDILNQSLATFEVK